MANFCPHCGAQLSRAGAAFCATCGRALQPRSGSISGALSPPLLRVQAPGQPETTFVLAQPETTIGRDAANDLVLDSPVVSRRHALVSARDGAFWVKDLHSTNGTAVNGQLVDECPLRDGDIIRIGDQQGNHVGLVFQQRAAPGAAPGGTIHLGRSDLSGAAAWIIGRDPSANLTLDHPTVSRQHAEVRTTAAGPHIRDLGSSNGTFVNGQLLVGSRPLAAGDVVQIGPYKLVYDQAGFAQYAPNGNYRIDAVQLVRRVTVGGALARLRGSAASERIILRDVSLSVQPREFVALVGGSGAGKSTLLNAMSGYIPADGRVLVNGDDLYDNFAAYRSILGYVPQDDIIHSLLPVRSALTYAARLRLPDASKAEITQRVAKVLAEVEMSEHAEKLVGRLSGGQRKRVSIASELLAEPGLFFLDEPTSGLDPGLEKKMMYTMRRLADGGRTVLLVTHATANIDQCTQVAFMADGRLTYFGPPQEALGFFGASDFADIYTRLSQPAGTASFPTSAGSLQQQILAANPRASSSEVWESVYRASPQYQRYVGDRLRAAGNVMTPGTHEQRQPAKQKVSSLSQFGVLARRYFDLIRRDTISLFILLAVMPLIGALLLVMANSYDLIGKGDDEVRTEIQQSILQARQDEDPDVDGEQFQGIYQIAGGSQRLLFMMGLAATLLGLFGSAFEIVKEAAIYQRERMVNLRIPPYLLSKIVILLAFGLVQCLLFLGVMGLRVDYPRDGILLPAVAEIYITLVLALLASITLGLLISAAVRSANTVIYVILFAIFVQIIFAGSLFDIPPAARPISYMTTTRWTLEALGSTVDLEAIKDGGGGCLEPEEPLPAGLSPAAEGYCQEGQTALPPAFEFFVNYDHTAGHLLARWLILLGFSAAFLGLTILVQRRKDLV